MSRWKDKSNPKVILEELSKRYNVNEKGEISSSSINSGNIFGVLAEMFNFNPKIPEHIKRSLLKSAFFQTKKDGKTNLETLQKNIGIEEQKHFNKPLKKYHVVTSISVNQNVKIPVVNIEGVRISISPSLPKKYESARKKIMQIITREEGESVGFIDQYVVVTVCSKTINEAADIALDKLDFVRAIWNFYFNLDKPWRISIGEHRCINRVKLGQYHSIHDTKGHLATETWWYEPNFNKPSTTQISIVKWSNASHFFNSNLTLFKKLNYRSDLEKYFINYVRALDSDDLHSSFLKLWVVIEQITGTTYREKKIGRAARIYSNLDFSLEIINYLRNFRDKAVHHNSSSHDIETILFHLKYIVEDHLSRLLGNKYKFESVNDFREFWDLPMSLIQIEKAQKELKNKMKRLEQIKQFRRLV